MELALTDAEKRLRELVAAAEAGERVVITREGMPIVKLVPARRSGGIDFEALAETRERLGIGGWESAWPVEWDDPALSRRVLGLETEPGR
jgi:prevent-host-death family protein